MRQIITSQPGLQRVRPRQLGRWVSIPLAVPCAHSAFVRKHDAVPGQDVSGSHERLRGPVHAFLVSLSSLRPDGRVLINHGHRSVIINSPVSPSRYRNDPFLDRADDLRYGGLGRGRSVSYSSSSSRSRHAFSRRRSSYEIPPVMNPTVAFSDMLSSSWRGGRKRALCVRTYLYRCGRRRGLVSECNSE